MLCIFTKESHINIFRKKNPNDNIVLNRLLLVLICVDYKTPLASLFTMLLIHLSNVDHQNPDCLGFDGLNVDGFEIDDHLFWAINIWIISLVKVSIE